MDVDSDADSRFADGTRNFVDWFQGLPGATFRADLIAVEDLRGRNAGRGIIAKQDIAPDTTLFTIPRNAIIYQSESGNEDGPSSSQDSWTLLILVLIYEYLQGDASAWKPYLDVLPSVFDTPMFWPPAELSELQASALVAKVGKEEADRMITSKILPVVREHEHLAHRMGSAIMAYAFDLEKDDDNDGVDEDDEWVEDREGKTMLGMVPMADILNADAEFNAHINHGDDALTATTLRTIRAGEEVLNYYGPLPNGELLRRYGYVTPKHSRYDVVELPWELVETELKERVGVRVDPADWEKVRQLARSDEDFEESFVLERSGEDPDSTGQLSSEPTFSGLPDELADQFKTFLKAVKKVASIELAVQALEDKEMRKDLYLQAVLGALQSRERQYATSLEDDDRILSVGELTGRQRMAVWVRRGEKQLLREAQSWVRQEMNERRNKASDRTGGNDGPAAKRRRF
ncbi:hypothetical protein NEMBOFW57_004822 [Staphylotrichum longicolle]|uniref:Ribosomal lysine N-methyltransferase 4 n=1 Tax=Staphylotrichum longicolle TaxID=669026 RepID=A0AAD4HVK2_9PEZI|nr:hypothetical protein NEMBOFW57_004822 [Staphylotrichum longicolle]